MLYAIWASHYPDYAGQIIFKNNDHLVFDDLGCLIEYLREPEKEVAVAYIKSNDKQEWVDVKAAAYIYNQNYWTPMNYGVLAFCIDWGCDYLRARKWGREGSYL